MGLCGRSGDDTFPPYQAYRLKQSVVPMARKRLALGLRICYNTLRLAV